MKDELFQSVQVQGKQPKELTKKAGRMKTQLTHFAALRVIYVAEGGGGAVKKEEVQKLKKRQNYFLLSLVTNSPVSSSLHSPIFPFPH